MKYFTYELWAKFNSEIEKEREEADVEWQKNFDAYWNMFDTIKNRFSKKFLNFYFKQHGFHDFRIKDIVLEHKEYGLKNPISVDIYITDEVDTFKITYKRISKFSVNYEETKGRGDRRGFDDWGYSEFIAIDDQTLSQEILFASGSTILINFKNGNVFAARVKNVEHATTHL